MACLGSSAIAGGCGLDLLRHGTLSLWKLDAAFWKLMSKAGQKRYLPCLPSAESKRFSPCSSRACAKASGGGLPRDSLTYASPATSWPLL